MIGFFLFVLGALVLTITLYDFLRTTISLSGLGPISSLVSSFLWNVGRSVALWSERQFGMSIRGALGPTILAALSVTWIALLLIGYTMMFLGDLSLVNTSTGAPATIVETVSFAGSSLSTLGASTVTPTTGWWDALSMIAAINGMIVLTLSVSFILGILQTTLAARALAVRYHSLLRKNEHHTAIQRLRRAAPLSSEMCKVAVELTASPLPSVFIPSDPRMNFAEIVGELCALFEEARQNTNAAALEIQDFDELRSGLEILGGHLGTATRGELGSARHWARKYSLLPR